MSGLIFKIFALKVEFWTTMFWMFVGEAIFGVGLLMITSYRRQFMALFRQHTAALLSINGSNEVINLSGSLGNRYALLFAPLSIVQAIGSTTTLFVFAFGVVLSVFFPKTQPGDLSARELVQKGVAAILVAIGVALVTNLILLSCWFTRACRLAPEKCYNVQWTGYRGNPPEGLSAAMRVMR